MGVTTADTSSTTANIELYPKLIHVSVEWRRLLPSGHNGRRQRPSILSCDSVHWLWRYHLDHARLSFRTSNDPLMFSKCQIIQMHLEGLNLNKNEIEIKVRILFSNYKNPLKNMILLEFSDWDFDMHQNCQTVIWLFSFRAFFRPRKQWFEYHSDSSTVRFWETP